MGGKRCIVNLILRFGGEVTWKLSLRALDKLVDKPRPGLYRAAKWLFLKDFTLIACLLRTRATSSLDFA